MVGPAAFTVNTKLQLWPPKLTEKIAVPAADGVPVIAKERLPVPFANVPAASVAVNPVTPVDIIATPAA